jgi:hypothetical protein
MFGHERIAAILQNTHELQRQQLVQHCLENGPMSRMAGGHVQAIGRGSGPPIYVNYIA